MSGQSRIAAAACGALTLCLAMTAGAAEVSSAATSACMSAVNHKYGGHVKNLKVTSSEFSQANSEVIVNADGERWRCLVSNDGKVEEVSKQGGQHASAASGNGESACMSAVNRNYGGKVKSLTVVGSNPIPDKGKTVFAINADGEHWSCTASDSGEVLDLKIR